MQTEPHPHLHGEAAIFVDDHAFFNVVVQDGCVALGHGAEAVGFLGGHGETGRTCGGVGAGVDDALLGLKAKVDHVPLAVRPLAVLTGSGLCTVWGRPGPIPRCPRTQPGQLLV